MQNVRQYNDLPKIRTLKNESFRINAGVGWRLGAARARSVLEQQRGVLEAQVRAQRVDAAVRGGAVRAQRALRRVRVEVVPAVGHLLAARLAAPQRRALRRRHEHAVVRVLRRGRQPRALCNQPATPVTTPRLRHEHSPRRYNGVKRTGIEPARS